MFSILTDLRDAITRWSTTIEVADVVVSRHSEFIVTYRAADQRRLEHLQHLERYVQNHPEVEVEVLFRTAGGSREHDSLRFETNDAESQLEIGFILDPANGATPVEQLKRLASTMRQASEEPLPQRQPAISVWQKILLRVIGKRIRFGEVFGIYKRAIGGRTRKSTSFTEYKYLLAVLAGWRRPIAVVQMTTIGKEEGWIDQRTSHVNWITRRMELADCGKIASGIDKLVNILDEPAAREKPGISSRG